MCDHWTLPDLIKHVIKLYPSRIKTPFTCFSCFYNCWHVFLHLQWWNTKLHMFTLHTWRLQIQKHNLIHPDSRPHHIWSWWSLQVWGVESNAAFKLNIFPRVTWSTCIFPGWTAEWLIVVLSRWVKFFVHFWRLTPRTLWSWMTKDSTQIYFNLWKMTSVGNLLIFNWMCRFNCPCSFTWVINKTCSWPVTFL